MQEPNGAMHYVPAKQVVAFDCARAKTLEHLATRSRKPSFALRDSDRRTGNEEDEEDCGLRARECRFRHGDLPGALSTG
eukprot:3689666-Rhodomonas_salina.1